MNIKVLFLLAGLLAVASGMVREGWFETRVDHFNPRNQDTFSMRYYANDEHAYRNGPIFVIVGGDWAIDLRYLTEGLFYDVAYLEGAFLFANEHRYFGHSLPFEDAMTYHLDFLTVDQALADLAEWISYLKTTVVENPNAKVVLLGYGHGGTLANYFHQSYPHLSNGVWVSSGPAEAALTLPSFFEVLGENIGTHGSRDCYNTIFSGFLVAQNLIALGQSDVLTELFHLCEPLDTENPLEATAFLLGLQTDIQREILHLRNTNSTSNMCEQIEGSDTDNSLHALNVWFAREHQFEECVELSFSDYLAPFVELDFETEHLQNGHRQRLYVQCTAGGLFPTSDSLYQPFGSQITIDFYVEVCREAFGDWIDEDFIRRQIQSINVRYGGRQPRIENAHFTHGSLDPLIGSGILEDVSDSAFATITPNTFFAPDLESIDEELDSPELIASKELTRTLIDVWIFKDFEPIHGEA
ncbi:thymus-specific serine protease-like [Malaya genurostris]|uniref:thymus-specific serine protease-like n=1 Tax=Malaya genurostris TaxID=325434 RepID=UPI0026F3F3DD|nr:thymus-specific serine protease-like [Malaya genurostris]